MAKKKTAKEIKRLNKRAKELINANLALEKRVRKLKKKLGDRKQQVADLRINSGQTPPTTAVKNSPSAEFGDNDGSSIVASQRLTWKQHTYLRDRYEFHLGAGATKEDARHLANEDLKQEYGASRGYTEEELIAILS